MNPSFRLAAALVLAASGAAAQDVTLGAPDAVLQKPFSLLQGAVEVRGRLLVTDWIEQRVAVVDLDAGRVTDRNRVGGGPGEFRLPGRLLAWPGDSALLVDVGNQRLAILDADGRIVRTLLPSSPAAVSPSATDTHGRLYYAIPAWMERPPLAGDSVRVLRWTPATNTTDTIARLHGSTPPSSNRSMSPRVPMVVFAPQDALAVLPDDRIAIVRGAPYRVEIVGRDRVAGPPVTVDRFPASAGERTTYVRTFLQSTPVSGRGEDGGLGHNPASAQSDAAIAEMVRATEFAETLPAVRPGSARTDAAGHIWVERWLPADRPAAHDVFDGSGARIATVTLPAGRRLLALGRAAIYLVATDATGLQTIERYAFPSLPGGRR